MSEARTLMVMAGGTGGHVFPGLAVAHWMRARGWRVVWLGSPSGMEAALVAKQGIPIEFVRFGGVRGKGAATKLMLPLNLLRACAQSLRALRKIRPDVVLGMGGYITFPAGLMAVLTRRPLVLHEQNSVAGLANKVLSRLAARVLVAFPGALPRSDWTGNPIREDMARTEAPAARYAQRTGRLRLLVVGGSLGAAALNETVPRALALLPEVQRPQVVHQAGAKHIDALRAHYAKAGLVEGANVQLLPFIDDMRAAYADADLVVCRSGAMTIAEVAAVGVAALFVPFPFAVDDHQTGNAGFLCDSGAAVLMQQRDLTAQKLATWIAGVTRESLAAMAVKARAKAMPDATERVAEACAAAAGINGDWGDAAASSGSSNNSNVSDAAKRANTAATSDVSHDAGGSAS